MVNGKLSKLSMINDLLSYKSKIPSYFIVRRDFLVLIQIQFDKLLAF